MHQPTFRQSINVGGKLLLFDSPKVMGILNITEDSFFDGGKYNSIDKALGQAQAMLEEGADIIDIGASSSRPGADPISESVELDRLKPIVKALVQNFPEVLISIDTYRSEVARVCIGEGAAMINDISGGEFDQQMFPTVASLKVPYVMMHMQGNPKSMQDNPQYQNVTSELVTFFQERKDQLADLGFEDILIDPGFGFGKTLRHNYQLLKELRSIKQVVQLPILVGLSRKSMINRLLGTNPESALNGTTAAHMLALINGADILRVHDVKEAVQVVKIAQAAHYPEKLI